MPEEVDAEHFQSEDEIALVNCGTTKGNLELRLVRVRPLGQRRQHVGVRVLEPVIFIFVVAITLQRIGSHRSPLSFMSPPL